jgi:hypothetical protein
MRYEEIRARLSEAAVNLPQDPQPLREWALLMAMTGVLNGIDRGLIPEGAEVVVHGSGSYGTDDFDPVERLHTVAIEKSDDMIETVFRSAGRRA